MGSSLLLVLVGFVCITTRVEGYTCGNGILEVGERCDDGNTDAADGCSSDCQQVSIDRDR